MVCSNPATNESSHSLEKTLREFNIGTFEIMDKYRNPSKKKECDKELKQLCEKYKVLLNYPKTEKKVVNFINSYLNS
jgi:hypothetical protein